MAATNIVPEASSVITHGRALSFDLDDGGSTPTYFRVTIEGAGTTVAWDLTTGFGSGYSGSATKVVNVYTVEFSKDAGWDASPFTVSVTYTISGVTTTEEWSYELLGEQQYPNLMTPRNPLSDNNATLDTVLNAASPDNEVIVPSADPVILKTSDLGVTPVQVENTNPNYTDTDSPILKVRKTVSSGVYADVLFRGDRIEFARSSGAGSFDLAVATNPTSDAAGFDLVLSGGQAGAQVGAGADGGSIYLEPGSATGSNDKGSVIIQNSRLLQLNAGIKMAEAAAAPDGVGSAGFAQLWVRNDTPNRLAFTDDGGTTHTLLLEDGKTGQDAALFGERADHVNTPAAGFGELWVKNQTPCRIYFTDDDGTDWDLTSLGSGDVTGAASGTDNAITRFNGTTGKIIQNSDVIIEDDGEVYIASSATDPCIGIYERAAAPGSRTATGKYWVKNNNPNEPGFTDDASDDYYLGRMVQTVMASSLQTNGTVNQWYSWNSAGPHHDADWDSATGGTGATPVLTTNWAYPALWFPRAIRLREVNFAFFNPDATGISHDIELDLVVGNYPVFTSAAPLGITVATASITTNTSGTPKTYHNNMTLNFPELAAESKLFLFVRETTGNASRVDMTNFVMNVVYSEKI